MARGIMPDYFKSEFVKVIDRKYFAKESNSIRTKAFNNLIVFEVEKLKRAIVDCDTFGDKEFLINYAYNKVQELMESVKSFDDCLPTFHQTYDDLMKSLLDIDETIKKRIEVINYYLDFKPVNRDERRALQSKHFRKYIKKHSKKRHTNGF